VIWTSNLSTKNQALEAAAESASQALVDFGGERPDIAFVFIGGHSARDSEIIIDTIRKRTDAKHLLGCTAGGVLGGGREVEQRASVALTLASLPGVKIDPFHIEADRYPDGDESPARWHECLGVKPDPRPAFVLIPDPFSSDAQQLLEGLDYAYPGCVKVGGLASGGHSPGVNRLFLDGDVHGSGTVGVALSGNLVVDTAVAQGCRPIGTPGRIDKSHGHYLIEVSGKPALQFVQEQIDQLGEEEGELARQSLFLGIAMDPFRTAPPEPGDYLIRNFLGVDRERGVLAVGEQLPIGRTVQLHVRDKRTSTEDLVVVLRRTLDRTGGASPNGALLFSCLGRGRHLYGEPDKDSQLFRSVVGDVPLGGFFCSGEIGPVGGETYLHGFTSSFGLFRPAVKVPG
jgi:small ligand-binding sensory domain FIST